MSLFAGYLAEHAKQLTKGKEDQFYAISSLENLWSQFKMYYCYRHPLSKKKNHVVPSCFLGTTWSLLRQNLICVARKRVREAGERESSPREHISDDHMWVIAFVAFFMNNPVMICLLWFASLLIQIGGRGQETAARVFKDQVVDSDGHINDFNQSPSLTIHLNRDKTYQSSEPRIFPQSLDRKWFMDFQFLSAILFIYRNEGRFREEEINDESPLFPPFHHELKKEREKKKEAEENETSFTATSLVLKFFSKTCVRIAKLIDVIPATILLKNKAFEARTDLAARKSHGGKKACGKKLAESHANPFATCFRMGYILQSVRISIVRFSLQL